jgi:hypothetical protein
MLCKHTKYWCMCVSAAVILSFSFLCERVSMFPYHVTTRLTRSLPSPHTSSNEQDRQKTPTEHFQCINRIFQTRALNLCYAGSPSFGIITLIRSAHLTGTRNRGEQWSRRRGEKDRINMVWNQSIDPYLMTRVCSLCIKSTGIEVVGIGREMSWMEMMREEGICFEQRQQRTWSNTRTLAQYSLKHCFWSSIGNSPPLSHQGEYLFPFLYLL